MLQFSRRFWVLQQGEDKHVPSDDEVAQEDPNVVSSISFHI